MGESEGDPVMCKLCDPVIATVQYISTFELSCLAGPMIALWFIFRFGLLGACWRLCGVFRIVVVVNRSV